MKIRVMTTCTAFRFYDCEVPDSTLRENVYETAAVAPKSHLRDLDDVADDEETASIAKVDEDGEEEVLWEEGVEDADV